MGKLCMENETPRKKLKVLTSMIRMAHIYIYYIDVPRCFSFGNKFILYSRHSVCSIFKLLWIRVRLSFEINISTFLNWLNLKKGYEFHFVALRIFISSILSCLIWNKSIWHEHWQKGFCFFDFKAEVCYFVTSNFYCYYFQTRVQTAEVHIFTANLIK